MKKIEWTKEEISDLCSYLRSNIEEESWGSIYIDALETRIRDEDMRQWYPDFYRALYLVKFEDLPLEINDVHPHVISWRLSVGK